MKNYRKRIADDILMRKLEGKGAVLIEGPKWCGKTTTAEQLAASILYMDDPEKKAQNITMSELNPKRLLKGATPRLIDEWQLAPKQFHRAYPQPAANRPGTRGKPDGQYLNLNLHLPPYFPQTDRLC